VGGSLEASVTVEKWMWHHIAEDLNFHRHFSYNPKSQSSVYFRSAFVCLFVCLFVLSEFNITVTATALCWFVCMAKPCYAKNYWHSDKFQAFVMVLQPFRSN
jgi:hypothetical protein